MKYSKEPEFRCRSCDRLLARPSADYVAVSGKLEIRCPRCKKHNILRATSANSEPHDGLHGDRYANPPLPA